MHLEPERKQNFWVVLRMNHQKDQAKHKIRQSGHLQFRSSVKDSLEVNTLYGVIRMLLERTGTINCNMPRFYEPK